MLNLKEIKKNAYILEFLKSSREALKVRNYTDHGIDHAEAVAEKARHIARKIGLKKREEELSAIAGFLHDSGNFLSRSHHNYLGALIFQNVFKEQFNAEDSAIIMQAIAQHDNLNAKFCNPVTAVVVLADKADVRRSRVIIKDMKIVKDYIHSRVNFAVTESNLIVSPAKKTVTLILKIDTDFVPIMEYFEIFTTRMNQCRIAAEYLGYNFGLVINKFKLL